MPEYENNHYVPRLVLRRYGDKINKYNLKKKEYIVAGNIKNAFNEKNLYPEELEYHQSLNVQHKVALEFSI